MDWTLEVVQVPVSDLDRAVGFYRDQLGFVLDHRTTTDQMDFAQLTPPGSGCSIVLGMAQMAPGSLHGLQLVVPDARAARAELVDRGVDAGEVTVIDPRDGGTLFGFTDPDGNSWTVQEMKVRAEHPLIPLDARIPFGAEQP